MNADAVQFVLAQSGLEEAGSSVIGIIVGFGLVLGILSIIVIALRMASANFQRHTRWATRGVEELPWVVLGVCLMLLAVPIVTLLLSGAHQDGAGDWDSMVNEELGNEGNPSPTPEPGPDDPR